MSVVVVFVSAQKVPRGQSRGNQKSGRCLVSIAQTSGSFRLEEALTRGSNERIPS